MAKAGVFNLSPKQKHALSKLPSGMRAAKMAEYKRQAFSASTKSSSGKQVAKKQPAKRSDKLSTLLGSGHYNAFHSSPQPIARAVGHATTLRGFNRFAKPAFHASAEYQLAIFTMSSSRYCGIVANSWPGTDQENWILSGESFYEISNTGVGTTDGPRQCLFGKLSVRLRNTSKAMNASGSIYVLALDAGCGLEELNTESWTDAQGWTDLRKYVMGCPRTRVFSGAELLRSRQWNTHPIDATKSLEFHECGPTKYNHQQLRVDQYEPVFSQIVFVFEKTETPNDFEFSVANQLYGRYEIGGVLANQAQSIPTAPINIIDGARKVMEEIGSVGHLAEDVIGKASAFKLAAGL